MAIKLMPCPFCGSDHIEILPQPKGWKMVRCSRCGAKKESVTDFNAEIANSWNLRAGRIDPNYFNDSCEEG